MILETKFIHLWHGTVWTDIALDVGVEKRLFFIHLLSDYRQYYKTNAHGIPWAFVL